MALTVEDLQKIFPKNRKSAINQELVNIIEDAEKRGDFEGYLENNIISFNSVLQDGRYKVQDYVKAVEYCCYYLNGDDQATAFVKTFPEKVKKRVLEGKSAYATGSPAMYHRGQLVQKILAQMQIPTRMLHHHKLNDAITTQYNLMTSSRTSDRIKLEAANSLMAFLKEPEEQKVELEIGVKKDESAKALEHKLLELADAQVNAFKNGQDIVSLQKIKYTEEEEEEIIDTEIQ
jgi:hypothetical protein